MIKQLQKAQSISEKKEHHYGSEEHRKKIICNIIIIMQEILHLTSNELHEKHSF